MEVRISRASQKGKKYQARFFLDGKRVKTTAFGAVGMSDFTKHRDEARKQRYLARHRTREDWRDFTSAGALSRWILWNKPTLRESIADYKQRFRLAG